MGKIDEGRTFGSIDDGSELPGPNAVTFCHGIRLFRFRCFIALLLSFAVFLSALFWLPPFFHSSDQHVLDLNQRFGDHTIVASFEVKKESRVVEEHKSQLTSDIFEEIGVMAIKVVVISVEPAATPNSTMVVFAMDPASVDPKAMITAQSLIRDVFHSLVIHQLDLRLTATSPSFGLPFNFDILKFPMGFTVTPPQNAFLLQHSHLLFSFSLHFSIRQIQYNFAELSSQLKSGLHLAPYENLYISLTNSEGSTVAAPTTVQSSVFLAVGGGAVYTQRLKQLALTISRSHKVNLGLNNTVFGSVNQVRLSSTLQGYLNGGVGNSPAPTPQPSPHSRHHHHRRHHKSQDPLLESPAPIPAPDTSSRSCFVPEVSPSPSPSASQPPPPLFQPTSAPPASHALPPARGETDVSAPANYVSPAPDPALALHSSCSCSRCTSGLATAVVAIILLVQVVWEEKG